METRVTIDIKIFFSAAVLGFCFVLIHLLCPCNLKAKFILTVDTNYLKVVKYDL